MFKQTNIRTIHFFPAFYSEGYESSAERVAEAAGSFRGRPADCRCGRPARASCWSASCHSPRRPPSSLCLPLAAPPPGWNGTPAPSPARQASAPLPPVIRGRRRTLHNLHSNLKKNNNNKTYNVGRSRIRLESGTKIKFPK